MLSPSSKTLVAKLESGEHPGVRFCSQVWLFILIHHRSSPFSGENDDEWDSRAQINPFSQNAGNSSYNNGEKIKNVYIVFEYIILYYIISYYIILYSILGSASPIFGVSNPWFRIGSYLFWGPFLGVVNIC